MTLFNTILPTKNLRIKAKILLENKKNITNPKEVVEIFSDHNTNIQRPSCKKKITRNIKKGIKVNDNEPFTKNELNQAIRKNITVLEDEIISRN